MVIKKAQKTYFVIAIVLILAFWIYRSERPPTTVSITFDAKTQIAKLTLKNESSRRISFYDTFTQQSKKLVTIKKVPIAIRVRVFSTEGQVLSKIGTFAKEEGWINVVDDYYRIDSPMEMTTLEPNEIVTGEAKLIDILGESPPYSELRNLKSFCVQFKAIIIFSRYGLFPLEQISEVFCTTDGIK